MFPGLVKGCDFEKKLQAFYMTVVRARDGGKAVDGSDAVSTAC